MDAAIGDELGILPLRELVQSGAGPCLLRLPEPRPALFLVQAVAMVLAEAIGYAGFLLFVLRVPNNKTEARWRGVERALLAVALIFAIARLLLWQPVRLSRRDGYPRFDPHGVPQAIAALTILLLREGTQAPEDYQRVRWVIWGCLIGLPAFLIAELASTTTIFVTPQELHAERGHRRPALPRQRLAVSLRVRGVAPDAGRERDDPFAPRNDLGPHAERPHPFLHRQVEIIEEYLDLPGWAWIEQGRGRRLFSRACTKGRCILPIIISTGRSRRPRRD